MSWQNAKKIGPMLKLSLRPYEGMNWLERFYSKIIRTDGCWLWKGTRNPLGYGVFTFNRNAVFAHRLSYFLINGEIPEGLTIDHLCKNTSCVNPSHLEAVTMVTNYFRGNTIGAKNKVKTHCKKGHPYDDLNTMWIHNGTHRACRMCHRRNRIEWGKRTNYNERVRQKKLENDCGSKR